MTNFNPSHSLRLFLAASVSFAVAVALNVPNPYWAVMPVWILVQTSRDEVLEKGLWRVIGTFVGVLLSVGLSYFVEPIWLKLLLISLLLGVTTGISHAFRGFNGYGIQMLGITLGAVVIPAIHDESQILGLAEARFLCTVIGVLAVSVLTYTYLPRSPIDRLKEEVMQFQDDLASGEFATEEMIQRLVELKDRSHGFITMFYSGEVRRAFDDYFLEALDYLLSRRQALPRMLRVSARPNRGFHLSTHRYTHLSIGTGVMIAGLGFVGSCLGIYSGWQYGHLLAMGFCILTAVLGGMSLPKKFAPHMLLGVVLGACSAMAYRLFLQPHLVTSWLKILGTLPIFALGAYLRTHGKFRLASVDFNMIFLLVGQVGVTVQGTPREVIESSLPIMIAGLVVTSLYMYFPRPYARYAQRQEWKFQKTDSTQDLMDALMLLRLDGSLEKALPRIIADELRHQVVRQGKRKAP